MKIKFLNSVKSIREIEGKINRNLFWICGGVTIVIMTMKLVEFFSRGLFSPVGMTLLYLGILIIYSFHKELIRWLGEKGKIERQGEYFVYGWIGFTTILYVINFFSRNYFSYSSKGEPLTILQDISLISLEVLAIFIFTRCLKILKISLEKRKQSEKE
ncbi:MAG: hypothetical protein COV63_00165 [Candidatus Nealsonbacteria bacterium CG11_big_fil_rev_8_21_14_0_20_37_68]|nr:MAG: hypothetical protein COV63_00165 [Candidatus Nealsonbacteria bacterium CG11_big_fil_rev_8_21_14_0_20_37_68]